MDLKHSFLRNETTMCEYERRTKYISCSVNLNTNEEKITQIYIPDSVKKKGGDGCARGIWNQHKKKHSCRIISNISPQITKIK